MACYFALKGHQLHVPTAGLYSQCYHGTYRSNENLNQSKKVEKKGKLSKDDEETIRELTYKAKVIF